MLDTCAFKELVKTDACHTTSQIGGMNCVVQLEEVVLLLKLAN